MPTVVITSCHFSVAEEDYASLSFSLHDWVKLHPPHISAALLESAMEQQWTKHCFSVEFSRSFALCPVMCDWRITRCSPHHDLSIIAVEEFNGPCFLPCRVTTVLTKWLDHLKLRMTLVSSSAQGHSWFMPRKNESGAALFVLQKKSIHFILKIQHGL